MRASLADPGDQPVDVSAKVVVFVAVLCGNARAQAVVQQGADRVVAVAGCDRTVVDDQGSTGMPARTRCRIRRWISRNRTFGRSTSTRRSVFTGSTGSIGMRSITRPAISCAEPGSITSANASASGDRPQSSSSSSTSAPAVQPARARLPDSSACDGGGATRILRPRCCEAREACALAPDPEPN